MADRFDEDVLLATKDKPQSRPGPSQQEKFEESPLAQSCTELYPVQAYSETEFVNYLSSVVLADQELLMLNLSFEQGYVVLGRWRVPSTLPKLDTISNILVSTTNQPRFSDFIAFDVDVSKNKENHNYSRRAIDLWQQLVRVHLREKPGPIVGRYLMIREPDSATLGILHYTMQSHFYMPDILEMLAANKSKVRPFRPRAGKAQRSRSMVVSINYMTFVQEDCEPMPWQLTDWGSDIGSWRPDPPLSRCSVVTGLSFAGKPRAVRKDMMAHGFRVRSKVFDPFGCWQVMSIEAIADRRDPTHWNDYDIPHSNGPEAFLHTLNGNLVDCRVRTASLVDRISELVQPPVDAPFNRQRLDNLLFDDDKFSNSRMYFWASQTLEVIREDIEHTIKVIDDVFDERVWEFRHPEIWPPNRDKDLRHDAWTQQLRPYQEDLQREFEKLREVLRTIAARQKQIAHLFDNLYSMTSVRESRLSAEMARATVYQGRNIKLLTLVSLIYLPLSFVAAIYGMTNIPQNLGFEPFGYTLLAICLPTYLVLAILLPTQGLDFWQQRGFTWQWVLDFVQLRRFRLR